MSKEREDGLDWEDKNIKRSSLEHIYLSVSKEKKIEDIGYPTSKVMEQDTMQFFLKSIQLHSNNLPTESHRMCESFNTLG